MPVEEIQAKSILRKLKYVDSWFLARYGMNLYRGCVHDCAYCDGRAEKYQVEGNFGQDIGIKINALELLDRELNPARKRKPMTSGFVLVGGGVGDSYNPYEKKYELARNALQLIHKFSYPTHMLTKSSLIERDIDLLQDINSDKQTIVSMSFSTVDNEIARIFEPGCTLPSRRLKTLEKMKENGIATGMFFMPVIPGVSDSEEKIEDSVKAARDVGVDFVLFGGMTLKPGRQTDHFKNVIINNYSEKLYEYISSIYSGDQWGSADKNYYIKIGRIFNDAAKKYGINRRIPVRLYNKVLNENDIVTIILQNLDYLCRCDGKNAPYGFAARSIQKLEKPLSAIKDNLQSLPGVGSTTERIILEILETGTCKYFESMME